MSKKAASRKTTAKKATATKTTAKKAAPKRATTPKGTEPTGKNLDIYGSAPIPWSRALKQLEAGTAAAYWLGPTKTPPPPPAPPPGAAWGDRQNYFPRRAQARKGRDPSPD